MEINHRTHNLRIAPRKLRLVADKMKYRQAEQALSLLPLVPNRGAVLVLSSLKSAIQVAKDNGMDASTLIVQQIWCDEGRKLKRSVSKSHGRMTPISKMSSHLSIVLSGEARRTASKRQAAVTEEK